MGYVEISPAAEGETLLSRKDAAELLTRMGFKTSPATLATKASRGGGPTFQCWGKKPLYRPDDLIKWATARLKRPKQSTSERDDHETTKLSGNITTLHTTDNASDRL